VASERETGTKNLLSGSERITRCCSSFDSHASERAVLYPHVFANEQARSGYFLAQQLEALRGSTLPERATRSSRM
jgi:hypothetical protein